MKSHDAFARCERGRFAMQRDRRGLAALAHHFDLGPSDVAIPSGAHRLHRGFFRGETRGIALIARLAARLAVGNFTRSVDAFAKALAGYRVAERALDPLHFDHVDAGSDDVRHVSSR